jgi:hypothetical protein
MPVQIRWADEARSAVVIEPSGDWSWETFYEATGVFGCGYRWKPQNHTI